MQPNILSQEFFLENTHEGVYAVCDDFILLNHVEHLTSFASQYTLEGIIVGLCTKGSISYSLNSEPCTVNTNSAFLISSGNNISDFRCSRDCEGMIFFGSSNFFQDMSQGVKELSSLFMFVRKHPIVSFSYEQTVVFSNYYKALMRKAKKRGMRFGRQVACNLMRALVLEMGDFIWPANTNPDSGQISRADNIFSEFLLLLEQNFRTQRRVAWYGKEIGVSPKYLAEVVKNISQETPNEWIDKYVIVELRNLLRNTSLSIKEIADRMNFPNQSFLGRYFKEHVGVSPSVYRNTR